MVLSVQQLAKLRYRCSTCNTTNPRPLRLRILSRAGRSGTFRKHDRGRADDLDGAGAEQDAATNFEYVRWERIARLFEPALEDAGR